MARSYDYAAIVAAWRETPSSKVIAHQFACNFATVLKALKSAGIKPPYSARTLDHDDIRRRRENGEHPKDIAEVAGCHLRTVFRICETAAQRTGGAA